MRQIVLITLLFVFTIVGKTQNLLLQEDFKLNTNNNTSLTTKTLSSGMWQFYYVDKSYNSNNSATECAVLKYSGSNMGYIITPPLDKPAMLVFDARLQNSTTATNYLEIQKSVNNGSFIPVQQIAISGTSYQQYTVGIDETNDNVRIKLLRSRVTPSESTNLNIIIDNVQVFAREDTPVLQVLNGTKSMEHNGTLCLNCYDNTSYAEIPFTLLNTGEGTLTVSNIEGFGCTVIGNRQFDIAAGSSTEIRVRVDCADGYTGNSYMNIHSNNSNGELFTVGIKYD